MAKAKAASPAPKKAKKTTSRKVTKDAAKKVARLSVKTAASSFKPRVHVRMYCQGLGDCFLLRFESKPGEFFDMLIDCGIYKASPDAGEIMNTVVDDVIATTGNKLDVLISTHEHWDHISGFYQALDKFKKMKIGQVWQSWTESPTNPLAKDLRKKYEDAKKKLVGLMRNSPAALSATPPAALRNAFQVMGFFGVTKEDNDKENGDAYSEIKKLMAAKNPRYFLPGEVIPDLGGTGVKVFVLGPPTSEKVLRQTNISKADAYEKQKASFFDGVETMLGAIECSLDDQVTDTGRPFIRELCIPATDARQSEFFQSIYGFDQDHSEYFRSIDDLAYDTLNSLALRMDNYTNNTSLVLAFQLRSGKVLLFPGDAQGGNWKSWANLTDPLKFDAEKTDAHQLLANTVLYKVGHHGSHNATPRTYGLDLMTHPGLRALVPVDHTIAAGAGYGEMPLNSILKALDARPDRVVYCADGESSKADGAFTFPKEKSRQLSLQVKKAGPRITRPLYCETSFDLDAEG